MKKKPVLYVVILCLWICCLGVLWFAYAKIVAGLHGYTVTAKTFIIVLLTINTVALSALWLGSVKDLTFSVAYAVLRKKIEKRYAEIKLRSTTKTLRNFCFYTAPATTSTPPPFRRAESRITRTSRPLF